MANGPVHILVGGGLVTGLYILNKRLIKNEELKPEGLLGSFCLGAAGGMLADILEPATSPCHRRFFHSIVFAAIIVFGKDRFYQMMNFTDEQKRYFDWLIAAHFSHLALDARTAKGLPFI